MLGVFSLIYCSCVDHFRGTFLSTTAAKEINRLAEKGIWEFPEL